ncbi:MAG TPA: hypothetical protein VNZ94_00515 [Xanthobacteraceae bacterium]|nr:hypothetical protein [Xanthobacteraceae bacterium]
MADVKKLRAEREKINAQIETLRAKATDLSRQIREAEGPIPDRSDRARGVGYTIKPSA